MTNFEKFKQDLTVERLADMLVDTCSEVSCDYCAYDSHSCINDIINRQEDCKYGIKKWLESEVE